MPRAPFFFVHSTASRFLIEFIHSLIDFIPSLRIVCCARQSSFATLLCHGHTDWPAKLINCQLETMHVETEPRAAYEFEVIQLKFMNLMRFELVMIGRARVIDRAISAGQCVECSATICELASNYCALNGG